MTIMDLPPKVTAPPQINPAVLAAIFDGPQVDHPDYCTRQCDGDQWTDIPGAHYHHSDFDMVPTFNAHRGAPSDMFVSVVRLDTPDGPGTPEIHLLAEGSTFGEDWQFTPDGARDLGDVMHRNADMADPPPVGEVRIRARYLLVGDDVLTDDGWQRIEMTLINVGEEQVSVYTPQRDGENANGWWFHPDTWVRVRRPERQMTIPAEDVRHDDHLLTPDGWQVAYMATVDGKSRTVQVFTPERNGEDTDGWQFAFGADVTVRRVPR